MNKWTQNIFFMISSLILILSIGCAKHAVLISTGKTISDDTMYHSEYWYDLFLQYKMLRENGFKDENIHVLYGDGTDFNTSYPNYDAATQYGHTITDMAVNKANIQSVFNTLGTKADNNDYIYVWWLGHGGGSGPGSCNLTMHISTTGETVTDTEFATYLNNVTNYNKRSVATMTCHSGGVVDNLDTAGSKTVILTSSLCVQSSYSYSPAETCNGRPHAEFNYTLPNALREMNPCSTSVASDGDSNGYVSLTETHQYNQATMTKSTPQMGDPDSIAPTTFIKKNEP